MLKEYLGNLEEILNPRIAYPTNLIIPFSLFYKSSKANGKENMAYNYFKKKYFQTIYDAFDKKCPPNALINLTIKSVLTESGRKFTIDPTYMFMNLAKEEFFFECSADSIEFANEYVENIRSIRKRTRELVKNNEEIEKDPQIYHIYKHQLKQTNGGNKTTIGIKDISDLNVDYKTGRFSEPVVLLEREIILNNIIDLCTSTLHAFKNLFLDLEKKKVNFEEIEACINIDAFALHLAIYYLEYFKKRSDENNYEYLGLFLRKFIRVVNELKQSSDFDLKTTYTKNGKKIVMASFKDFLLDYKKYENDTTNKKLEYFEKIDTSIDVDYRDYRNVEIAIDRLKKKEEIEVLVANWNLIPKGEVEKKEKCIKVISEKDIKEKADKEVEKLEIALENTDYKYWLEGKEKFLGYRGFLYENGYILFERVRLDKDDNYKAYRVKENATYMMSLENFTKMSKFSKPEIIAFIKNGNTDVRRIFHTSKWQSEVMNVQNKLPYFDVNLYPDGIISIIKELIDTGEIIKETKEEYNQKLYTSGNK